MNKKLTDAELVDMIAQNTTDDVNMAMRFLYATHYNSIKSLVLKNSGVEEDVKDIFQETIIIFLNVIRRGNFELTSSIKTYLYAVARNLWFKQLRNKPRNTSIESLPDLTNDEEVDYEKTQRRSSLLKELFHKLKEDCQKVLIDFYYYNASIKEIMLKYNLGSMQAAKNKKYRCLSYLTDLCNKNEFGHGL